MTRPDPPSAEDVFRLLGGRRGHFVYESRHHGDLWFDVPAAFLRPKTLRPCADALADRLRPFGLDAVCGPMVEGAFLAVMVAEALDVAFVYAEAVPRESPDGLFPLAYRVPDPLRGSVAGKTFAVVDDCVNAGSAAFGAYHDLTALGARPVALGALLVLGDRAPVFAARHGLALAALASLESPLWAPSACPLCAWGVPLNRSPTGTD